MGVRPLTWITLLFIAWTGCSSSESARVRVRFDAEAGVVALAQSLELTVRREGEAIPFYSERRCVSDDCSAHAHQVFPMTLPIEAPGGPTVVHVTGTLRSDVAILGVVRAILSLRPGASGYLSLLFEDGCQGVLCDEGTTCFSGECTDACFEPSAGGGAALSVPHMCEGVDGGTTPCECECPSDRCVDGQCLPAVGAVQISAGGAHACALVSDGRVFCWGENTFAQLGLGPTNADPDLRSRVSPTLVPLPGPVDVDVATGSKISAGRTHTCAVVEEDAASTVYCWGDRADAKTGRPPGGRLAVAAAVERHEDWASVSSGDSHTCAIRAGGGGYCWGGNHHCQLAKGSDGMTPPTCEQLRFPQQVWAAEVRRMTAGGRHTCAIRRDTVNWELYCWGDNREGQLGREPEVTRTDAPHSLPGNLEWTDVSAGEEHSCGVAEGVLYCWGSDTYRQIARTRSRKYATAMPAVVPADADTFVQVSAGRTHSCALDAAGDLFCTGANAAGQLGLGTTTSEEDSFQRVPRGAGAWTPWIAVDAGGELTCALRADATVWCWGLFTGGRLGVGDGDMSNRLSPARVCIEP